MFKVRKKQQEAFSEEAVKDFEDRMVTHLGKFFPANCEALGERSVRRMIRWGIQKAAGYGVVAERGVCIYIDAMFAFGRDFDADPALPWAAAILRDRKIKSETARADRLFDAAFDHILEGRGITVQEVER
jgi:hypothetical protein